MPIPPVPHKYAYWIPTKTVGKIISATIYACDPNTAFYTIQWHDDNIQEYEAKEDDELIFGNEELLVLYGRQVR
jgi:hypothetical protein